MPRNRGVDVDTATGLVRDRDGCWYPLDSLVVSGNALYYRRTLDDPLFTCNEKWLLPDQGWVINRLAFRAHVLHPLDWYMETDAVEVDGAIWRVRDGYLDLEVYEGARYELRDADELADGIAAGELTLAEALATLRSLDHLCRALRRYRFSGHALLDEYAPGLPR